MSCTTSQRSTQPALPPLGRSSGCSPTAPAISPTATCHRRWATICAWGDPALIETLIDQGLVERRDGGLYVPAYLEWNPPRADFEQMRAKGRKRAKEWREKENDEVAGSPLNSPTSWSSRWPRVPPSSLAERQGHSASNRLAPRRGGIAPMRRRTALADLRARHLHPAADPGHRDGSALIASRAELDHWLRDGGGVRP